MVPRPSGLATVRTELRFNLLSFNQLEIDLRHVNFGAKGTTQRSNFSIDDVAAMARSLLHDKAQEEVKVRHYGDELCNYYRVSGIIDNTRYRIIVCRCSDKPQTLGIITLFKESK